MDLLYILVCLLHYSFGSSWKADSVGSDQISIVNLLHTAFTVGIRNGQLARHKWLGSE